jgi:hypothetical protein
MKSLAIIGRRWFQKTNGNTYHSVEIVVDGRQVHRINYAYGYDSQYRENAKNWLLENGYLPGMETKPGTPGESLWRYCERSGIALVDTVTDVARKKDL